MVSYYRRLESKAGDKRFEISYGGGGGGVGCEVEDGGGGGDAPFR